MSLLLVAKINQPFRSGNGWLIQAFFNYAIACEISIEHAQRSGFISMFQLNDIQSIGLVLLWKRNHVLPGRDHTCVKRFARQIKHGKVNRFFSTRQGQGRYTARVTASNTAGTVQATTLVRIVVPLFLPFVPDS